MQAVILAGGKGTRLAPYTMVFPKPMLPVGGQPIIETIIRQLAFYGFKDIVISLGYLGDMIELYFRDRSKSLDGIRLRYVREDQPLGTAGALSLIDDLDENFLVINGDILTTLNYENFYRFHQEKGSSLTVAVGEKKVQIALGILTLDEESKVKKFDEKPVYTYKDNIGIYIYNRRALRYIEKGKRLDLNILIEKMIADGDNVFGYMSNENYYWIDVGQHADFEQANQEFEKRKKEFLKDDC
ncbi:MAG: NTP transferase domain-containing protein [Candidatus Omnitrophica bacterium]|nr:NTP transferase domain-containing protein [Candidatus Omnitrophota bacterium]